MDTSNNAFIGVHDLYLSNKANFLIYMCKCNKLRFSPKVPKQPQVLILN